MTVTVGGGEGALLTQSVVRRLRDEIFAGQMAPGTPLSVPGLAARLEVSRSPVREAVQQLVVEGLAAVSYTHLTLPTKRIV